MKKKIDEKKLKLFEKEELPKFKNPLDEIFREHLPKQIILIAICVVVVIFLFLNINTVKGFIDKIINILMPIIIGFILTYLMAPLYNMIVRYLNKDDDKNTGKKSTKKFAKPIATFICMLVVLFIGAGLIILFVPQLYISIANFVDRAGGYISSAEETIQNLRNGAKDAGTRALLDHILLAINDSFSKVSNLENIDFRAIFSNLYTGFYLSFKTILNIFVGLVVMAYTLNMKEELAFGCKRAMFALCKKGVAQKLLAEIRFAHKVFSGFLVGKLLDSLIIGVLCYICCLIMKMPYTPLISVIVGITNIIPFFGPFIGAIPSFVLILLEEPFTWRPWGFLLFILALQQLDGNVIGPKILGDKTGVGSFWVLFSILLFGGLFGFVGMIIAVPLWAIITKLFNEYIVVKLNEKNYPLTEEDYKKLKTYYQELGDKKAQSKK